MLTTATPGVDAERLLRRVREEAERRRSFVAPPEPEDGDAPDDRAVAAWGVYHGAASAAQQWVIVGGGLPPMTQMRGLRRWVAVPVAKAILRAAQLVTRDQTFFNDAALQALRGLGDVVRGHVDALHDRLRALRAELAGELARGDAVARALHQGLDGVRAQLGDVADDVHVARREAAAATQAVDQRLDAALARVAALEDALARSRGEAEDLRRQLGVLDRRTAVLFEQARDGEAAGAGPSPAHAAAELEHLRDDFYVRFEDRFRGSRDEILARMRVYVPIVAAAGGGTADRPVLDLGCGRGEWLELLREEGLVGRGIDLNRTMVSECAARGLAVDEGDALAHLAAVPDGSLGAVTGMHLIEHLPFEVVVALLQECARVLAPGGVAVFETPNPQNLLVGASTFHIDPTHRNPLHPITMEFVAGTCGLARVRTLPLHPASASQRLPEGDCPLAPRLNEYLFGPQDFAVIGYRP